MTWRTDYVKPHRDGLSYRLVNPYTGQEVTGWRAESRPSVLNRDLDKVVDRLNVRAGPTLGGNRLTSGKRIIDSGEAQHG